MKLLLKSVMMLVIFSAFSQQSIAPSNVFCGIKNRAFKEGEVITMKVFYNSMGIYIGAG